MRQLRILLLACTVAAATGPVQSAEEGLRSIPHSFSDVLEFTPWTEVRDPGGPGAGGGRTFAQMVQAGANFVLVRFAPAELGSSRRLAYGAPARGSLLLAPGEVPKPEEWMTLFSGLIAMLFIARRKLSILAH